MSRRTTAIAAALSVLALGSPLISGCANPLAINAYNSGLEKYEQGDYLGAIADYSKAIEINPQDANAYSNRGVSKSDLKDYQGAISDYGKAIQIDPKNTEAYYNSGNAKYTLKGYREAIDYYSSAIAINPKYAIAYSARGISKELIADLKGACRDWRKAADFGLTEPAEWVKKEC